MTPNRATLLAAGALVSLTATSAAAAHAAAVKPAQPVIGKPVTAPARPLSGKRFTVSFKVTRSDTHAALTGGKMTAAASIAGKAIRHSDSLKAGLARISLAVPADAAGKRLVVKVTVRLGKRSSARTASFAVQRGTPLPSLSVGNASVPEGNSDTATLSFPVTLSAASAQAVKVRYSTADGTANAPGDYAASSGTLTFKPGARKQTIRVAAVGDGVVEEDETFGVTLTRPTNAKLARATAAGTIANDDVPPRSGHYAGQTSQGRAVAFDFASDPAGLTNVVMHVDLTCTEVPVTLPDEEFGTSPGVSTPVAADGTFALDGQGSGPGGLTFTVVFHGRLVGPGSGEGTLRVDIAVPVPDIGIVHCSSGDLSWTAS